MTTDPLDALAHGDRPVVPRSEFATQLRAQLQAELDLATLPADSEPSPATSPTTASPTTASPTTGTPTTGTPTTGTPRSMTMSEQPTETADDRVTAPIAPSLSMYLAVRRASEALKFYEDAFGAEITMRLDQPDGRVGHAEVRIGDSTFSVADEFPEYDVVGPETLGNTTATIELTVPDVDAVFARALAAGAVELRPVADEFYGARSGRLQDPFGHRWSITTPTEQVSNEELQRRLDELYAADGEGTLGTEGADGS